MRKGQSEIRRRNGCSVELSRKWEARATSQVAGGNQDGREGWRDMRWWSRADSGLYSENNEKLRRFSSMGIIII